MFAATAQRLRAGRSIARSGDLDVVKGGKMPQRRCGRSEAIQTFLAWLLDRFVATRLAMTGCAAAF